MGVIVIAMPMRLFGRLNELIYGKPLEQYSACSKWSIHIEAALFIVKFSSYVSSVLRYTLG